eukprot:sb/3469502/
MARWAGWYMSYRSYVLLRFAEKGLITEKKRFNFIFHHRLKKQQSLEKRRQSASSSPDRPIVEAVTEHRYPELNIPTPTIVDETEIVNGSKKIEEEDPIKGSRSPSGRSPRVSLTNKLVNCATSPFAPLSPRNASTSPLRGTFSPAEKEGGEPLYIERGTNDRPYTDEQLISKSVSQGLAPQVSNSHLYAPTAKEAPRKPDNRWKLPLCKARTEIICHNRLYNGDPGRE